MKKKTMQFLLCAGLLVVVVPACKKDQPEAETDTQSSSDNSVAESEFTNIFNDANDVLTNTSGAMKTSADSTCTGKRGCNSCVLYSITQCGNDSFPKIITLDYSGVDTINGCVGCDGKTRKGKLVITLTGKWKSQNSTATIVPTDYYVNANNFTGQIKYTNLTVGGFDSATLPNAIPKFKKEVSNGSTGYATVTLASGAGTVMWKCDRTIEMSKGYNTPLDRSDDSFKTWGTADGVNRKSRSFSLSVTEATALKKDYNCKWIVDGKMDITPSGLATRTLNFAHPNAQGSGVCDSLLEISVHGKTKIIAMP